MLRIPGTLQQEGSGLVPTLLFFIVLILPNLLRIISHHHDHITSYAYTKKMLPGYMYTRIPNKHGEKKESTKTQPPNF